MIESLSNLLQNMIKKLIPSLSLYINRGGLSLDKYEVSLIFFRNYVFFLFLFMVSRVLQECHFEIYYRLYSVSLIGFPIKLLFLGKKIPTKEEMFTLET